LNVPVEYMEGAVQRYIEHGIPPGEFLTALFNNDLKEAFRRADEANTAAMREWVIFMVNEMPAAAQGSPERVLDWIKRHEAARLAEQVTS
jgi:hypothetical protein